MNEIINLSADGTPDHGKSRPTRTLHRDPLGRYSKKPLPHRQPKLVQDAVSGQLVVGRDDSMLHRLDDGDVVHSVRPDYSGGLAISSTLDDGKYYMRRTP